MGLTNVVLVALFACTAYQQVAALSGSEDGVIAELSYAVQLRYVSNGKYFCTGTLVSREHVVTAASCVNFEEAADILVVAGAPLIDGEGGVHRNVTKIALHPQFDYVDNYMDAAVLKLESPVAAQAIKPIVICSTAVQDQQALRFSSWGYGANTNGNSVRLRTMTTTAITRARCQQVGFAGVQTLFCTAKNLKQLCYGDAGSGAIRQGQLCGIGSDVAYCDGQARVSRYTNIMNVKPFIENQLKL